MYSHIRSAHPRTHPILPQTKVLLDEGRNRQGCHWARRPHKICQENLEPECLQTGSSSCMPASAGGKQSKLRNAHVNVVSVGSSPRHRHFAQLPQVVSWFKNVHVKSTSTASNQNGARISGTVPAKSGMECKNVIKRTDTHATGRDVLQQRHSAAATTRPSISAAPSCGRNSAHNNPTQHSHSLGNEKNRARRNRRNRVYMLDTAAASILG